MITKNRIEEEQFKPKSPVPSKQEPVRTKDKGVGVRKPITKKTKLITPPPKVHPKQKSMIAMFNDKELNVMGLQKLEATAKRLHNRVRSILHDGDNSFDRLLREYRKLGAINFIKKHQLETKLNARLPEFDKVFDEIRELGFSLSENPININLLEKFEAYHEMAGYIFRGSTGYNSYLKSVGRACQARKKERISPTYGGTVQHRMMEAQEKSIQCEAERQLTEKKRVTDHLIKNGLDEFAENNFFVLGLAEAFSRVDEISDKDVSKSLAPLCQTCQRKQESPEALKPSET